MTVWIIIGLILLAAFGPVFWLLPSKRDRMLAKLRMAARRRGVVVEVTVVPKLDAAAEERVSAGGKVRDPKLTVAAYRLPLRERTDLAPSFSFLRHEDDRPAALPGWVEHPDVKTRRKPDDPDAYWREVALAVDGLGDDFVGVEANATNAALYWKEYLRGRGIEDAMDDVLARLRRLAELQIRVDEALREPEEDAPEDVDPDK